MTHVTVKPSVTIRHVEPKLPSASSQQEDSDEENPIKRFFSNSSYAPQSLASWNSRHDVVSDSNFDKKRRFHSGLSISCRLEVEFFNNFRKHIQTVIIYTGHAKKPHSSYSPYAHSISRLSMMFQHFNGFRSSKKLSTWKIIPLQGEELFDVLKMVEAASTLLVIPAGESSNLDKAFTLEEKVQINQFFYTGGRGYFTCGSAYWVSKTRTWKAPCISQPDCSPTKPLEKLNDIPLFDGDAVGPLCPLPVGRHGVGFFSKAVTIKYGEKECTVFLGGGGSLILKDPTLSLKSPTLSRLPELQDTRADTDLIAQMDTNPNNSDRVLKESATVQPKRKGSLISKISKAVGMNENPIYLNKDHSEDQTFLAFRSNLPRKAESLTDLSGLEKKILGVSCRTHKDSLTQKVRVLASYKLEQLLALGLSLNESKKLQNATIMVTRGNGAAILTMFHLYYNSEDLDPERYERELPHSGTDWREIMTKLSPFSERLACFAAQMEAIDTFDFNG